MNLLAHIYLAGENEDHVIGQVMADFLERGWRERVSAGVLQGIRLHQQVDMFTDSHDCTEGRSHVWFATREERWTNVGEPVHFGSPRKLELGGFPTPFPTDRAGFPGISPLWPAPSSELFFVTAKAGRSRPDGDFEILVASWTLAPGTGE